MQLNQLLSWFESLRAWSELGANSQGVYRILIKQGVNGLGPNKDVTEVHAKEADELYSMLVSTKGMHKAVSVCVILRKVWNDLIRYEKVTHNPFMRMGLSQTSFRKIVWTDEQVKTFVEHANEKGISSLGLLVELCYTFGQRVGDMRLLRWDSYDGEFLRFVQQKTQKAMVLYVPLFIRDRLDQLTKLGPYIVVREDTLRPYTEDDYLPIFKKVLRESGLPDTLQLRDTRKSAITQASENGATDSDLQNLGGHDTRSTLNIYQITTEKAAIRAMGKRFGT